MERISTITASNALNTSGVTTIVIGGGFIGALFTAALYGLFGKTGTIVILVLLGIFASVLTFNVNLSNIFKKLLKIVCLCDKIDMLNNIKRGSLRFARLHRR